MTSVASKVLEDDFDEALEANRNPIDGPLPGCIAAHDPFRKAHRVELLCLQEVIAKLEDVKPAKDPEVSTPFGNLSVTFLMNSVKVIALIVVALTGTLGLWLLMGEVKESRADRMARHSDMMSIQRSVNKASGNADQASDKAAVAVVTVASTLKKTGGQKQ